MVQRFTKLEWVCGSIPSLRWGWEVQRWWWLNTEHRGCYICSATNSVSARHLLRAVCLVFHSLHSTRALFVKVFCGEFVYGSVLLVENCFMLGFEYMELKAAVTHLIPRWSLFLWQFVIWGFRIYGSGMICDGQSSRNTLQRLAEYSSAANRTKKFAVASTVTISGSCANAQVRGAGSRTALRWF